MSRALRMVALVLFASSGGCSATADGVGDGEAARAGRHPIVGGSPATDYEEAALIDMGNSACSGTVIAPRVVLTAGHCVINSKSWDVTAPYAGGQTASAIDGLVYDYTDTSQTTNPNMHDVGIVILGSEITLGAYPTIADTGSPDGTSIVNIGRIQDGQFSSTDLFVSQPIKIVDGAQYGFPYDYSATEIIQPGDSGGPDMLAGTHTIVSVNSGAGSGSEVLARVDLVYDWIQEQIAANGGTGSSTSGGSTSGVGATTRAPPRPRPPPPRAAGATSAAASPTRASAKAASCSGASAV
jgi:hypothetical protein